MCIETSGRNLDDIHVKKTGPYTRSYLHCCESFELQFDIAKGTAGVHEYAVGV